MRLFKYHKSIYRQPLMDDRDREEEALAGLAIAEATKLWSYCQRPSDKYGRRETCEMAAATAERLFRRGGDRSDNYESGSYGSYGRSSRSNDYSSASDDDDYRRKHRPRRRSSASYGTQMIGGIGGVGGSGYVGAVGAMPVPAYGSQQAYGQVGFPAATGYPIAGAQSMYAGQAAYGQPSSYGAQPIGFGGGGVGYQYGAAVPGGVGGLAIPQQRARTGSFGYGGASVYPTY